MKGHVVYVPPVPISPHYCDSPYGGGDPQFPVLDDDDTPAPHGAVWQCDECGRTWVCARASDGCNDWLAESRRAARKRRRN